MTRTIPLAALEDGEIKRIGTKRTRVYVPRVRTDATPADIARARELFAKLSPRGQAAAIRFIAMLAKDEGVAA